MEPAITSDEKLMFQTDAWWMVSDCPVVRHGDLEPDVDDATGVSTLACWWCGQKEPKATRTSATPRKSPYLPMR